MYCINKESERINCPKNYEMVCRTSDKVIMSKPENRIEDYRIFECSTITIPTPRSGGFDEFPLVTGTTMFIFTPFLIVFFILFFLGRRTTNMW